MHCWQGLQVYDPSNFLDDSCFGILYPLYHGHTSDSMHTVSSQHPTKPLQQLGLAGQSASASPDSQWADSVLLDAVGVQYHPPVPSYLRAQVPSMHMPIQRNLHVDVLRGAPGNVAVTSLSFISQVYSDLTQTRMPGPSTAPGTALNQVLQKELK